MDDFSNRQNQNTQRPIYPTPFNVDLFDPQFKNFFEEYTRRVLSLPEPIQNILMDPTTADFVEENLGSQFNLSAEQKTEITRIIRDVLLGDISINEMASKISENLGVDPTTAYQIQGKIVNELFASAIEDIKKTQKEILSETPQPYRPPVNQAQPRYTPPPTPPRSQNPPASPGNVVDLRNPK